jgi:hypothetical protein
LFVYLAVAVNEELLLSGESHVDLFEDFLALDLLARVLEGASLDLVKFAFVQTAGVANRAVNALSVEHGLAPVHFII